MSVNSHDNLFYESFFSARTRIFTVSSLIANLGLGAAKTVIGTVMSSLFLGFNGIYNIILGVVKLNAIRRYSRVGRAEKPLRPGMERKICLRMGAGAVVISAVYLVLSVTLTFFYKDSADYDVSAACFIALCAFTKLITGIVSAVKTKTMGSRTIHYLKLLNIVDGLVAIGLTQRALLFMKSTAGADVYSGIGGIVFAALALAFAVYMLIAMSRKRQYDK